MNKLKQKTTVQIFSEDLKKLRLISVIEEKFPILILTEMIDARISKYSEKKLNELSIKISENSSEILI